MDERVHAYVCIKDKKERKKEKEREKRVVCAYPRTPASDTREEEN